MKICVVILRASKTAVMVLHRRCNLAHKRRRLGKSRLWFGFSFVGDVSIYYGIVKVLFSKGGTCEGLKHIKELAG